jgi:hypothetical protein
MNFPHTAIEKLKRKLAMDINSEHKISCEYKKKSETHRACEDRYIHIFYKLLLYFHTSGILLCSKRSSSGFKINFRSLHYDYSGRACSNFLFEAVLAFSFV